MDNRNIYYFPLFGQLGNQLSVLAHLIAFAETYNYKIIYPNSNYLKEALIETDFTSKKLHFSKWLGNKYFSFFIKRAIKIILLNKNCQNGKILIINKSFIADNEINPAALPTTIIITNWLFRHYKGVINNCALIREQLSFKKNFHDNPNKIILKIKEQYQNPKLIGVHVRRGDYVAWENGKYFYDLSDYYSAINEMSKQIENCVFLVCSNEDIEFDNTNNLNIQHIMGSAIEDICTLSKCDYIMGPPSTFSGWAAFIGNKLIYFIKDEKDIISLDKFTYNYI